MVTWPVSGGTVYAHIESRQETQGSAGGSTLWYLSRVTFNWIYCTGTGYAPSGATPLFNIYTGAVHPVTLLDSTHVFMQATNGQESNSNSHLAGELTNGGFSFEVGIASTRAGTVNRSRVDTLMIR